MPGSTGRSTRYHLLVTRMPITHLVLSCSIILILPLTVSHPSCFDHSLSVVAIKKTVDTPLYFYFIIFNQFACWISEACQYMKFI
jgi:hypothetical protein